jgi:AcrR family transcriptional regulator
MEKQGSREPKRRNAARTRAAILEAARQAFSTAGYAQAGIRDIAAIADINSALVSRYFGSKELLYEAALAQLLDVKLLLETDRENFGRHVAALISPQTQLVNPVSMMVLSTASPDARAVTTKLLERQIILPLAKWLGPPHAKQRAIIITTLCAGFTTFSRLLPLMPSSSRGWKAVVDWLAEALQEVVDIN